MPTEMVDMRGELVSGLMACAQGLDVQRISLTTSVDDLRSLLTESVVLNLTARMFKHRSLDRPWMTVTWNDDANLEWEILIWLTPDTFVEFFEASELGRWTDRPDSRSAELTDAELRLTIDKESTRNGA